MRFERIVFVSTFDYPTRYAHARHGFEMAKAYAKLCGTGFTFVVNTALEPLPVRTVRMFGPVGRRVKKLHLRRIFMPFALFGIFLKLGVGRQTLVVTTDPAIGRMLWLFKRIFGFRCALEMHAVPDARMLAGCAWADALIVPTAGIRDAMVGMRPELAARIHVVPNAVDIAAFDAVPDDRRALRDELGLPHAPVLIGYIGRFEPRGEDKGLGLMIEAMRQIPDAHLVLVGGTRREVADYEERARDAGVANRVIVRTFQDAHLVPRYAKACDILVYVPPSSAFTEIETSPMKLFEYMAARRPLIVSDTDALRAIVGSSLAYLVPPGDGRAYHKTIAEVRTDVRSAAARAVAAHAAVKGQTWEARAARVAHAVDGMI